MLVSTGCKIIVLCIIKCSRRSAVPYRFYRHLLISNLHELEAHQCVHVCLCMCVCACASVHVRLCMCVCACVSWTKNTRPRERCGSFRLGLWRWGRVTCHSVFSRLIWWWRLRGRAGRSAASFSNRLMWRHRNDQPGNWNVCWNRLSCSCPTLGARIASVPHRGRQSMKVQAEAH